MSAPCPPNYPVECSKVPLHHRQQETYCAQTKEQCKTSHRANALSYDSYRKKKKQVVAAPNCTDDFPIDCATVSGSNKTQQSYCTQTVEQCQQAHQTNALLHNTPYRKKKRQPIQEEARDNNEQFNDGLNEEDNEHEEEAQNNEEDYGGLNEEDNEQEEKAQNNEEDYGEVDDGLNEEDNEQEEEAQNNKEDYGEVDDGLDNEQEEEAQNIKEDYGEVDDGLDNEQEEEAQNNKEDYGEVDDGLNEEDNEQEEEAQNNKEDYGEVDDGLDNEQEEEAQNNEEDYGEVDDGLNEFNEDDEQEEEAQNNEGDYGEVDDGLNEFNEDDEEEAQNNEEDYEEDNEQGEQTQHNEAEDDEEENNSTDKGWWSSSTVYHGDTPFAHYGEDLPPSWKALAIASDLGLYQRYMKAAFTGQASFDEYSTGFSPKAHDWSLDIENMMGAVDRCSTIFDYDSANMRPFGGKKPTVTQAIVNRLAEFCAVTDARGFLAWHSVGSGKTISSALILDAFYEKKNDVFFVTSTENLANVSEMLSDLPLVSSKVAFRDLTDPNTAERFAKVSAKLQTRVPPFD